ncbi:hypothetical protein A8U91_04094 [Halomonas elongata]|uniref:Uncharacterized protein n=1 Tax=Halomonas elongata TaxID=2746 RepID=A0A1B8NYF8_HALEL|nr:hypothetical protein A8U91_04094 [Halomonas elongata]
MARQVADQAGGREPQLVFSVVTQVLQSLLPGDLGGLPHAQGEACQPQACEQAAQGALATCQAMAANHGSGRRRRHGLSPAQ